MAETYFGNLRKVGASVDEGLAKLQDTWNMPHVLLCNNSDETRNTAKELLENLTSELKILRDDVDKSKNVIIPLEEEFTRELDKVVEEVNALKKELDEIRVLFVENGYIEEEGDVSVLDSQLEALSFNNSYSFTKDVDDLTHSSTLDNNLNLSDSVDSKTPIKNVSHYTDTRKPLSLNEPPTEPIYSPCYYKIIKK